MSNDGFQVDPATRVEVAKAAAQAMLDRATRIATYREAQTGAQAVIPVDTFRMNLMAILAALMGESRAERLAIDDEGAGAIAQILRKAEGTVTVTFPRERIEQAREIYGQAALSGRHVDDLHHAAQVTTPGLEQVPIANYRPVAAAAMALGSLLVEMATPQADAPVGPWPGSPDGE